jgi:hypothetical protein
MQESVIYKEILFEGRQQGEEALIMRLLTGRIGSITTQGRSHPPQQPVSKNVTQR